VAELDVDAGGRLVQDEQVGLGDQGSSEQESAFHPAGEPVEALVALVVDPDAFENLVGSVGGFGVRNAVVARLVFQYFSDREESVDVELLWGEADGVAGLPVVVPTSWPKTRASPPVLRTRPTSVLMNVVLPAR